MRHLLLFIAAVAATAETMGEEALLQRHILASKTGLHLSGTDHAGEPLSFTLHGVAGEATKFMRFESFLEARAQGVDDFSLKTPSRTAEGQFKAKGISSKKDYKLIKTIGVPGTYGEAYIATGADNQQVVLKYIKRHKYNQEEFDKEFEFLMKVSSLPHVARCLGRFDVNHGDKHFLVMETYAMGDMFDAVQYTFTEKHVPSMKKLIAKISVGLEAIHSLNIVHRDMKWENVFAKGTLTDPTTWDPYVADLGLSLQLSPDQVRNTRVGELYAPQEDKEGTASYIPPEEKPAAPLASFDQYSFGVMIKQLLNAHGYMLRDSMGDPFQDAVKKLHSKLPKDRLNDKTFREEAEITDLVQPYVLPTPPAVPAVPEVGSLRGPMREVTNLPQASSTALSRTCHKFDNDRDKCVKAKAKHFLGSHKCVYAQDTKTCHRGYDTFQEMP